MRNQACSTSASTQRSGFTIIEFLVVISIIGVLTTLFLPAVMEAREAARRTVCISRLRQIGLALHSYESMTGVYPPVTYGVSSEGRYDAFSPYARILPHLELTDVYRRIHWTAHGTNVSEMITGPFPSISEILCPSDGGSFSGSTSFGFSMGALPAAFPAIHPLPTELQRLTGAFNGLVTLRTSDFRDGLTNTAGISEIRFGTGGLYDPTRDTALVSISGVPDLVLANPNYWTSTCASVVSPVSNSDTQRGRPWIVHETLKYNHILPPNSAVIDCASNFDRDRGLLTSRSYHKGRVHTLMMDGHVRPVANSISNKVWWSLGTRMGADTIAE